MRFKHITKNKINDMKNANLRTDAFATTADAIKGLATDATAADVIKGLATDAIKGLPQQPVLPPDGHMQFCHLKTHQQQSSLTFNSF